MKLAYALAAALAVGAGFGYADHFRKTTVVPSEHPEGRAAVTPQALPGDATRISGRVLEVIDVEKYTYLRLATGQGETWVAVSRAAVPTGSSVTVEQAARMDHFVSTTLKRTFDVIYFGSLAAPESALGAGDDPGIPQALLANPGETLPPGHPSIGQPGDPMTMDGTQAMPAGHPGGTETSAAITVPKLARAPGPDGHVIADIFARKAQLAGKRVRIRGIVTKITLDVLGQTFLHVRDGSGDDAAKTNDLVVTTRERPARGDVLLLEGILRTDADLGIGYRYPALLENAVLVKE
jgi:hypothetical protein